MATSTQNIARITTTTCAASLALLLTACGGGGGGTPGTGSVASTTTTTGNTGTTTSTPVANNGSLTTPQYPAGSQELAAFNQLNSMRQQCGFPVVTENTLLDQAAANHMNYMALNKYIGHYEVQGNPGFTGITLQNRAITVGYPVLNNEAAEVISPDATNVGGAALVMRLASVPYHLSEMFYPLAETGINFGTVTLGPSATEYTLLMDFSNQPSTVSNAVFGQSPLTFPCQGTTGVDYESASGEDPQPYVNGQPVNTGTNPIGTPITVIGNLNDTVLLSSATLTDPNNNQIPLNITNSSNDPNHILAPFAAFAFATNPLSPNTTYMATLIGTINGNTFTRQFSFTTGNQGQF